MAKKNTSEAYEWVDSIIFALCATMVIIVLFFSISLVSGDSMYPTLKDGERVIVQKIFYTPAHGDIITTDSLIDYGKPLVKRVIGLAGDKIEIDKTGVYLNGKILEEEYLNGVKTDTADVEFPIVVPEGKIFVMGDNRPGSADSRFSQIGLIDERDILGKVCLRISLNAFGEIS